MSSLHYTATLDTGKLETSIKQSSKSIKNWAKDFQDAGHIAEQSFDKLATSFQQSTRRQLGLIADMERALKTLKEQRRNAFTVEEIEKYNKKIQEAEIHLKEYNEIGRQSVEVSEQAESGYQKISGAIVAWAAKIFTAVALWKTFKGVIESTERTAEEFRATVAGARAGLDYFMKSVATAGSGGFDGFIAGIKNAIRAGREFSKEQDRINNIRNEYAIKEADLNKEIEEQRRIFYEDDKTSNDDKLKASDKMLDLMKKKADMEIEIATKSYNAQVEFAKSKNKLSEEEIRYAIENYQRVEKIGGAYNRLKAIVDAYNKNIKMGLPETNYIDPFNTGAFQVNRERIEGTKRTMAELDPEAEKMGRIFAGLQKMTDKERKAISDGVVAVKEAENQFYLESRRVFKMRENMVDAQTEKEKEFWKSYYDWFYDQLDKQAARLEQQKKEIEKFVNSLNSVDPGLGYSMLNRAINNSGGRAVAPSGKDKLRPFNQDVWDLKNEKAIEDLETQNQLLEKQEELRGQIVDAVGRLSMSLSEQLGLDEDFKRNLDGIISTLQQGLSGNFPGAIASLLSMLISVIPTNIQEFAAQTEYFNRLLEEQERLIAKSSREGNEKGETQTKIDLLKKQRAEAVADLAKTTKKLEGFFGEAYAALGGAKHFAELKQYIKDLDAQIEETMQNLDDLFTGGLIQNDIAEIIETGFREGSEAGAEAMDEIMKNALSEIFRKEVLGPQVTEAVNWLRDAMSDNKFTNDEREEWERRIKEISDNNKELWDNLTQAYDFSDNQKQSALTGIARAITEETGSELVGLNRREADDLRTMRDYSKLGVEHLLKIEYNTAATVDELRLAVAELKDINTNTKPTFTGGL